MLRGSLQLLFICILCGCIKKEQPPAQEVLVKVGQQSLSAEMFAHRISQKLRYQNPLVATHAEHVQNIKNSVVEEFISESLVREWARRSGFQLKDSDIEKNLKAHQRDYPDDLSFKSEYQRSQNSYALWKESLRQRVLEEKLFEDLRKKITPLTDKEKRAFYKEQKHLFRRPAQIRIRQIVVEKKESAERILRELKRGRNFSELAKKFSIAPEAKSGGDTNWLDVNTLPLLEKVYKMAPRSISPVIQSPYGFHIIEVLGKKKAGTLNYQESLSTIENKMIEIREQEAYSHWLDGQLRKVKVEKNVKAIAAIKVQAKTSH